jgi:hypothetical protein
MPQSKGSDCLDQFRILEMCLTCNLDELARILNREPNPFKQQRQAIFAAEMMAQQTEENGAPLSPMICLWQISVHMLEQATAELTDFANDSIKENEARNVILSSKDQEILALETQVCELTTQLYACKSLSDKGYSGVPELPTKTKPKKKRKAKGGSNEPLY